MLNDVVWSSVESGREEGGGTLGVRKKITKNKDNELEI
jgi:hypothetical protein